jgi:hypothetical protein
MGVTMCNNVDFLSENFLKIKSKTFEKGNSHLTTKALGLKYNELFPSANSTSDAWRKKVERALEESPYHHVSFRKEKNTRKIRGRAK